MKNREVASPFAMFVLTLVLVVMFGVVDCLSGYELQFFVFYYIPITIAAWSCGRVRAYVIAILSAVVWFVADVYSGHPYSHFSIAVWNTAIRLLSFLIIGYTVAQIRSILDDERKISSDLEKALSEVKALKGLLPICSNCKKIRNDQGYWLQIEEYLSTHTDAQFTHGYCQECAAKVFKDAGIEIPAGPRGSVSP